MIGIIEQENEVKLGAEEKLISLNILLVIYIHNKRYADAIEEIEALLNDPELATYKEHLVSAQAKVSQAIQKSQVSFFSKVKKKSRKSGKCI